VFGTALDPVKLGLVESISRPGGNATGVNFLIAELGTKQLGLLVEMIPGVERIAVLVNPEESVRTETAVRGVVAERRIICRKREPRRVRKGGVPLDPHR
jgi:putative ABC transport system substrate-binding protein